MNLYRLLLGTHASYIFITGVWPLLHIASFMIVTGPKTDVWLVKTVGALLLPVALCMFSFMRIKTEKWPAIILGGGTAIAFMWIDLYYALTDVISDIYLADAAVEFIFFVVWTYFATNEFKKSHEAV